MLCALVCVRCDGPSPRIRSVSASRVAEHSMQSLVLNTEGCATGIDLDHAAQTGTVASLHLGGIDVSLPAVRNGSESFTVALGDVIPPGMYPLDLVLDDGRVAPFDGSLTVTALDPVIAAVSSPRSTIGFGETHLPLSIGIDNPSACAVDGLRVVPSFRQGGTLLSFPAIGPLAHLEPHAGATVDFVVDVSSDAMPGTILINAVGVEGTRTGGPGCSGDVSAASQARDAAWVVVPAVHQSITITDLRVSSHALRIGELLMLTVTARNDATVSLTPERLDVDSAPPGIVISPISPPLPATLAPGATETFTVLITALETASTISGYVVSVVLTARDAGGSLFASPGGGPSIMLNVH